MRNLLPFAVLAILAVQASAQSFTDSFDNATYGGTLDAAGNTAGGDDVTSVVTWRALNLSSQLGTTGWFDLDPSVFPDSPTNSGEGAIGANYNNTAGGLINNWLLSPTLTFNNGDVISFYTRTPTGTMWADRLRLMLSLNGSSGDVADFTTTLLSVNEGLVVANYPQNWTQFSATISGLSGATSGRFAFNYNVPDAGPTGTNSNFIGIDDVSYDAVPEPATMAALAMGTLALLRRRKKAA